MFDFVKKYQIFVLKKTKGVSSQFNSDLSALAFPGIMIEHEQKFVCEKVRGKPFCGSIIKIRRKENECKVNCYNQILQKGEPISELHTLYNKSFQNSKFGLIQNKPNFLQDKRKQTHRFTSGSLPRRLEDVSSQIINLDSRNQFICDYTIKTTDKNNRGETKSVNRREPVSPYINLN